MFRLKMFNLEKVEIPESNCPERLESELYIGASAKVTT